jgi:hypothetical protein
MRNPVQQASLPPPIITTTAASQLHKDRVKWPATLVAA